MGHSAARGLCRGIERAAGLALFYTALSTIAAPSPVEAAPFTHVRNNATANSGGGTTLSLQVTGVGAGNLVLVYVKYEGAATTVTVSDGASAFAADAAVHAANGDLHGQFFYALAGQAAGTVTYTATFAASKTYRKLFVFEYSHGGTSAVFDASNRATAASGSLNSGGVTTTGSDEVVFGAYGEYSANDTAAEQIGGVAAEQVRRQSYASVWSKTFTNPMTGAATATGNSSTWIGSVIAFKATNVAAFDFALGNGGARSVARGGSVTNSVTATLTSGAAVPVSFTSSGQPSGVTAGFGPASCTPDCTSTLTLSATTAATLGTSTITVTGTAGSLSRTTSFALTVVTAGDTAPPTVALSAPAAGALLTGTTTVTATASDNVGVTGVQFLLDGANLGSQDTSSPYSVSWNTTTAALGPHVLAAQARDAAGNVAAATGVAVTVDNQAPTGSVVINAGAAATNSLTAALTLAATDGTTGISQMRFSNTGSSYSTAEAFAPTKTWSLSSGTGTKTVYAQFRDGAGNWSTAVSDTIVYDTTAPTISAVASGAVTSSGATITWTTNEAATSQVEYGPTTAYGSLTPLDPALLTAHTVGLGGLVPLTTYNYRVRSKDAAGNERLGSNNTVRTLGVDQTAPSVPTGLAATPVSGTAINLSWTASTDNVAVTGYDVFKDAAFLVTSPTPSFASTGLAPATSYTFTVAARDAAGNVSAPSTPVTASTLAFAISNVKATSVTTTGAIVSWDTDAPASSQVEYGTTTAYSASTALAPALVSSHAVGLSGLLANTTYHYRVRSTDGAGHLVVSGDFVMTTNPGGSSGVFQNELLVTNLTLPTALKFLPDGKLVVTQLGGQILRIDPGTWQVMGTFLQLTNIGTSGGQQGLMDIALDPDFATNRYYYLFYTLGSPNRDRVSRFTATADLAGTVAGSEMLVYQDPENASLEHHGGALAFGSDGKLYVTTGEHFGPDDSQALTSPRGKVLRVNKDGTVPTDNPFYDGTGPNVDAIWARGLRNPFRSSFDAVSGRLYVGDVGANDAATSQEEVNVVTRGANLGWPECEGNCAIAGTTNPWYSYTHSGRDAAVVGGFVYRGTQFPSQYYGSYFFADYTQNWIKRLTVDANGAVTGVVNFEPANGAADGPYGDIVYLSEGPDGALYYVDLGFSDTTGETVAGKIRRIRFISNNQPPTVVATAAPTEGAAPLAVAFSSAGTTDPEGDALSYTWTFGDGGTATQANPSHVYAGNGAFTARVSVFDGSSTTLSAPITIQVGNKPVPVIVTPATGLVFRAGDVIAFAGEGSDPEDGVLPASAFTWDVDFLHEGHVHPGLPVSGVKSGSLAIPTSGHDFHGNTRYRITLTVTDADGLRSSTEVVVVPDKVNLSFATLPGGLQVTLDGIPYATPLLYDTLIGFNHQIAAINQSSGQTTYTFASWSDGGAQQHTIVAPASPASYTATYTVATNPVPAGLLAGYAFGEGSGVTTADVSLSAITGSLVNAPGWTTGKYGGGLAFTGSNYVDLGNPAALQLTGSMTLCAWVKISSNPGDDGAIVAKLAAAGWQLKTSADTGVRTGAIQISSNGSTSIQRYGATVLAVGTWYHLAGVYDSAARTLSIYVNGLLDNGVLAGTVPASQANAAVNVNIGQRTGYPGSFNFLGTIDEVHVFGRALSAAEIQMDMNTPRVTP